MTDRVKRGRIPSGPRKVVARGTRRVEPTSTPASPLRLASSMASGRDSFTTDPVAGIAACLTMLPHALRPERLALRLRKQIPLRFTDAQVAHVLRDPDWRYAITAYAESCRTREEPRSVAMARLESELGGATRRVERAYDLAPHLLLLRVGTGVSVDRARGSVVNALDWLHKHHPPHYEALMRHTAVIEATQHPKFFGWTFAEQPGLTYLSIPTNPAETVPEQSVLIASILDHENAHHREHTGGVDYGRPGASDLPNVPGFVSGRTAASVLSEAVALFDERTFLEAALVGDPAAARVAQQRAADTEANLVLLLTFLAQPAVQADLNPAGRSLYTDILRQRAARDSRPR